MTFEPEKQLIQPVYAGGGNKLSAVKADVLECHAAQEELENPPRRAAARTIGHVACIN
jgi:hypothetical protein